MPFGAAAAAAAGGLASGLASNIFGGKAAGTAPAGNTTTTTVNPTQQAQLPFLQNLWGQTQNLGNSGVNFNAPGFEQVAGFTPQQTQALNLQSQRALSGSPVNNSAQGYAANLLNGNLLSAGNPYFSAMSDQVLGQVLPGIESTFAGGNRMNSPGAAYATAQGATNALGGLAYQNYKNTLGLMNQESFNAPNLANQDYLDLSRLYGAGAASQGQQQQYINEAISNYYRNQQAPWTLLQNQGALFGQPTTGSSSVTQPYFTNQLANAAGGAAAGLGLYNGLNNAGAFNSTPGGSALYNYNMTNGTNFTNNASNNYGYPGFDYSQAG